MVTRKSEKKRHCPVKSSQQPPPPTSATTLRTLFSAIESPAGLNPVNIKRLYAVLSHLSLNLPIGCYNPKSSLMELGGCLGLKLYFKDIQQLSDILFTDLAGKFKHFFSVFRDVSSLAGANGKSVLTQNMWVVVGELTLLLRCCLVVLDLIAFDHNLLMEKSRFLLLLLGGLISVGLNCGNEKISMSFTKWVSRECGYVSGYGTTSATEDFVTSIRLCKPSDPCYRFMCPVLEVFADELLMHESIRNYLLIIDSASPKGEMLFKCHYGYGSIGSLLEVFSAQFILSISDEQGFENFLNRLFWCHNEGFRLSELNLSGALSLLLNPIVISAPKMFQAYLIVLVSEAIGICMPSENIRTDVGQLNSYLEAVERSVFLYTRHMSGLHVDGHSIGDIFSLKSYLQCSSHPTFKSLLQPATRDKLDHVIAKSEELWPSYMNSMSILRTSDLVEASITYVKENICIFDDSYKDEVFSLLNCILLRSSSESNIDSTATKGEASPQDFCLLASILKLMSSSLLQVVWHMRLLVLSDSLQPDGNITSYREYIALMDIVGHFKSLSICKPIQKFFYQVMLSYPSRHKESKWIFLHIAGLLQLTFATGSHFIVKSCLFTLMALLNLLAIEEGDLSALGFPNRSYSSKSFDEVEGALIVQESCQIVSTRVQKIQEMYLRMRSLVCISERKYDDEPGTSEHDSNVIVKKTKEVCSGEAFLKCIRSSRVPDFDDLSDFIVCRQGKDYGSWLRDRQKFRLWKYKKMTALRWRKNKAAWNSMKGSRACRNGPS
ncbi:hypothetical protein K2173_005863 [Erythroxylum novogranatense]|uniref:DUF7812 domain-containing protein n=1 Tax=Erythroxylum novogranatense TaxID=1862640 RepID=A0AAV8U2U2_9ROSI|nr:hypothetical protein K2173_005863 [Erythroxylum novogranatense]